MSRCQYCGRVVPGRACNLRAHIRKHHPEHAGDRPVPPAARRDLPSPWKLGGLSVVELSRRVWDSINSDDILNRAAELAYYFFFSLFPALILVTAIFGLLAGPGTRLHEMLLQYMRAALPVTAFQMVQTVLTETSHAAGGGKITFGLLVTLWSSSAAMTSVQDTLNAIYDVPVGRPYWKAKGIAIGLTIVCSILMILTLIVILYGHMLARFLGNLVGMGTVAAWAWKIAQWPIALFFLALLFSLTYYYAPDLEHRHWEWLTPGAVAGIATWIIASLALRAYLHYFNSYSATYGSLGAVIILLTWFYVTGFMILMGAEVNAEIENAAARQEISDATRNGPKVLAPDDGSVSG